MIKLNCENCKKEIIAGYMSGDGFQTNYNCSNCNHQHDLDSFYSIELDLEIEYLQNEQYVKQTVKTLMGAL